MEPASGVGAVGASAVALHQVEVFTCGRHYSEDERVASRPISAIALGLQQLSFGQAGDEGVLDPGGLGRLLEGDVRIASSGELGT